MSHEKSQNFEILKRLVADIRSDLAILEKADHKISSALECSLCALNGITSQQTKYDSAIGALAIEKEELEIKLNEAYDRCHKLEEVCKKVSQKLGITISLIEKERHSDDPFDQDISGLF